MSAPPYLHFYCAINTEWAARFSDQKASGLTVRQWRDQNHVSIHKYNYWKHQLKEEVVDQTRFFRIPDIVPSPVSSALAPPDPAPLQFAQPEPVVPDRAIRANCTNMKFCVDGVSLEVEPSINEDFLRVLIRAEYYA